MPKYKSSWSQPNPFPFGRHPIMVHDKQEIIPRRSNTSIRWSSHMDRSRGLAGDRAADEPLVLVKAVCYCTWAHEYDFRDHVGCECVDGESCSVGNRCRRDSDLRTRLKE